MFVALKRLVLQCTDIKCAVMISMMSMQWRGQAACDVIVTQVLSRTHDTTAAYCSLAVN